MSSPNCCNGLVSFGVLVISILFVGTWVLLVPLAAYSAIWLEDPFSSFALLFLFFMIKKGIEDAL
jgi:hypothetical protein